jgi:hypothetical protein
VFSPQGDEGDDDEGDGGEQQAGEHWFIEPFGVAEVGHVSASVDLGAAAQGFAVHWQANWQAVWLSSMANPHRAKAMAQSQPTTFKMPLMWGIGFGHVKHVEVVVDESLGELKLETDVVAVVLDHGRGFAIVDRGMEGADGLDEEIEEGVVLVEAGHGVSFRVGNKITLVIAGVSRSHTTVGSV